MALGATMHVFTIRLADADRGVYETLNLRVARHPSETAEYLLTRVLAYCLEYSEGIAFSRGLSDTDEPAISIRDLTGALQAWIEVGAPEAARLHKAAKAAPRVAVYVHRDLESWRARLEGERITAPMQCRFTQWIGCCSKRWSRGWSAAWILICRYPIIICTYRWATPR